MKVLKVLRMVFFKPFYFSLGIITAIISFFIAILWQNFSLLTSVWIDGGVAIWDKLSLSFNLLGGISSNFTPISILFLFSIVILLGMNISLIVFYLKRGKVNGSGWLFSSGGFLSGILGVGCAACGSLVLVSLLPFLGGTAFIAFLPLGGEEFSILAIILLIISIIVISKQINKDPVCNI